MDKDTDGTKKNYPRTRGGPSLCKSAKFFHANINVLQEGMEGSWGEAATEGLQFAFGVDVGPAGGDIFIRCLAGIGNGVKRVWGGSGGDIICHVSEVVNGLGSEAKQLG